MTQRSTDARLQRIVQLAASDVGLKESGGPNRGPEVEKFFAGVGLRSGDPWCAGAVSFWLEEEAIEAGVKTTVRSKSAVTLFHAARSKKLQFVLGGDQSASSVVKPGWVWVRSDSSTNAELAKKGIWTIGHVAIVEFVGAQKFRHISGNTNAEGSREGTCVGRHDAPWDDPRTVGWFNPIRPVPVS